MLGQIRIGCAGWTIPARHASLFPHSGSHLKRYVQHFATVEINSSFHRPHRRATYERWAATVPEEFLFAVKTPKEITHDRRLAETAPALDAFLAQTTGLGDKLGPLLFQLPPTLNFDPERAGTFFAEVRARFAGSVVCEPRHPDWFKPPADDLLAQYRISRVAADPPVVAAAAEPGGWNGLVYYRLHGSPRMYYSEYARDRLEVLAQQLARAASDHRSCWCVFDNTAIGAATINALALQERLGQA